MAIFELEGEALRRVAGGIAVGEPDPTDPGPHPRPYPRPCPKVPVPPRHFPDVPSPTDIPGPQIS